MATGIYTYVHGDYSGFSQTLYREVLPQGYMASSTSTVDGSLFVPRSPSYYAGYDSYNFVHTAHFLDGDVLLSPTASEYSVYKLYDSAYGRDADKGGLAAWTSNLTAGMSLANVAQSFVTGSEFANLFGRLSNQDFVKTIYHNALHRAPDASGLAYYTDLLDHGTLRGEVLASISESQEHAADIVKKLPHGGLFVVDGNAAYVEELYDTMLGRLPDRDGLKYWIKAANAGTDIQTIADQFARAPEFTAKYAGMTDADYVRSLYLNTLHRQGEASGVDYCTDRLAHGDTRAEVATGFAFSDEHGLLTRPATDYGLMFL